MAQLCLVRRNRRDILENNFISDLARRGSDACASHSALSGPTHSHFRITDMDVCVCFVIARSSWFTFGLLESFLSSEAARAAVDPWHEYTNFTFQLFFVVLMIATLVSFLRERNSAAIPGV